MHMKGERAVGTMEVDMLGMLAAGSPVPTFIPQSF